MPAPALVRPMVVAAMALEIVSTEVPVVNTTVSTAAVGVKAPPLMVELAVARMPPLESVKVMNGLMVTPAPVFRVRELKVVFETVPVRFPGLLVSKRLAFAIA